ncbi:DUF3267 domain-containing protein [Bacillus inaquosorum]|uniref:DUF3267 domain-containing protein n=1 Tax=Bacillus inaquosorum TaxID=483913 RepID=UPI00227DE40D|nr:DUF3267 domain-containing protein [Bacillus inaquosorum]MCY7930911.1 DUF3267 domain-containing protein [Bacillus inaquosorum]MCY8769734.1 DUF3267 domain-containing protein [Bacillus inaquosorum]
MSKLTSSSIVNHVFFLIISLIGIFFYAIGVFCKLAVYEKATGDWPSWMFFLGNIATFLSVYVVLSVIHEYSHAFVGMRFNVNSKVSFISKLGFKPYCKFDSRIKIKKHEFIKIALAPFFVITGIFVITFILFYFLLPWYYEFFVIGMFLVKVAGCSGDLKLCMDARKLPSDKKMVQSEDTGEFLVV